ncbi:hypothetical protein [Streptomyces sp. NPDC047071]|uniref:hypothetical protein n=1 Tax=Streptomyces sp. NPDC047071 TaxID=3154808 RepID=UPI00345351D0
MTNWQRVWWGLALLGAGSAVGLLVWVTVAHPEGSAQAWGVFGAVAGVAALGVALWQLRTPGHVPSPAGGPPAAPPAPAPPGAGEPVIAERGAIAARKDVTNSSTRYTGSAPPASAAPYGGAPGVAGSDGGIAAGGNVENSHTEYGP